MALEYIGQGRAIPGVPASDLSDEDLKAVAANFGLSLAETEGLLIERKLYRSVPKKSATKAAVETKDGE